MAKKPDYGMLTFCETAGRRGGRLLWRVTCDCGKSKVVLASNVIQGYTRSCGCVGRAAFRRMITKHGMSGTPTYSSWYAMIVRCQKNLDYVGRVAVCRRWLISFENFFADMGVRPKWHTLDRVDNDKGYYKSNCRWATPYEQSRNTRSNVMLTYNGTTMCAADWAARIGINPKVLRARISRGWSIEEVLTAKFDRQRVDITAFGRTQTMSEWAAETGLHLTTLRGRLLKGMPPEDALTRGRYKRDSRLLVTGVPLSIWG